VLSSTAEAIQTDTKDSNEIISSAGPKYNASSPRGKPTKERCIEEGLMLDD
jgi:hypothetical protein